MNGTLAYVPDRRYGEMGSERSSATPGRNAAVDDRMNDDNTLLELAGPHPKRGIYWIDDDIVSRDYSGWTAWRQT